MTSFGDSQRKDSSFGGTQAIFRWKGTFLTLDSFPSSEEAEGSTSDSPYTPALSLVPDLIIIITCIGFSASFSGTLR